MNESTSTELPQDFPGRGLAWRLGTALLVGLVLTLALVVWDNTRRSTLEGIVEATAVGDTRYVSMPEPLPPKPFLPVAQLDGRPLVPTGYKRYEKDEARMQSVGRDESAGLTIYQELAKKKATGKPVDYFLKAGPGEFLKVRPADPAK